MGGDSSKIPIEAVWETIFLKKTLDIDMMNTDMIKNYFLIEGRWIL